MAGKGYRVIAPDRYLQVRAERGEVTVRLGDEVIAQSSGAVWLAEGDRPEVVYVPLADIDAVRLVRSEQRYHCRWKGEAVYYHVDLVDRTLENVVWGYPEAPENIAVLRERVAFDSGAFVVELDGVALERT